MTKLYVASYVNEYDYDTFTTSSELREYSMADFASGFTAAVGSDRDRVLAKCKEMFIREYAEYDEEDDAEAIRVRCSMIEGDIEYIQNEKNANEYRVELLGDVIGSIVIREFDEA